MTGGVALVDDTKLKASSLSADAAEFIPYVVPATKVQSPSPGVAYVAQIQTWQRSHGMSVNEVPKYLTSCYPFVDPDQANVGPNVPRLPQNRFPFPVIPGGFPIQTPPHVRFSPWQSRPGLPTSILPPTFDPATNAVQNQGVNKVQGLGLIGSQPAGLQNTTGLQNPSVLFRSQSPSSSPRVPPSPAQWMINSPRGPRYVPPRPKYPKPQKPVKAAKTCASTFGTTTITSSKSTNNLNRVPNTKEIQRPQSPVLISRSSQTELPIGIRNHSLSVHQHSLFIGDHSSNALLQDEGGEFDSGYSSPQHQNNLVSIGTQASPDESALEKIPLQEIVPNLKGFPEAKQCSEETNKEGPLLEWKQKRQKSSTNADVEEKKKRKKKKDRDATRSPARHIGSATRLLSRSSSSVSSVGTKPDDDDEKIDLHSWTDFPPMSARPPASAIKPTALLPDEKVPLTIERQAHGPPWTIKFPSEDGRSGRSRSASGDVCKAGNNSCSLNVSTSTSVKNWSNFKHKVSSDIGAELSSMISASSNVPLGSYRSCNNNTIPLDTVIKYGEDNEEETQQKKGAWRGRNRGKAKKQYASEDINTDTNTLLLGANLIAQQILSKEIASVNPHILQNMNACLLHSSIPEPYTSVPSHYNFPPPLQPSTTFPMYSQLHQQKTYAKMMQTSAVPPSILGPGPLVNSIRGPSTPVKEMHQSTMPSRSNHQINDVNPKSFSKSYQNDFPSLIPMNDFPLFINHNPHKQNVEQVSHHENDNVSITAYIKTGETEVVIKNEPEDEEGDDRKKKRRRRRRRRSRKNKTDEEDGEDKASDGSACIERAVSSSNVSESTLHFEDVEEFPDLLTASSRLASVMDDMADRSTLSGTSMSYSDVMKTTWSRTGSQSRTASLTGSGVSDDDNGSCYTGTTDESKRARRRRRRREKANLAAEEELAEISLEQQWLKSGLTSSSRPMAGLITDTTVVEEAKKKSGVGNVGKKANQPIALDIAAMIEAIQKKPTSSTITSLQRITRTKSPHKDKGTSSNPLDSSAPLQKRGKERETGRTKKPSPLKKVILKEREQRKRLRLLDEDPDVPAASLVGAPGVGVIGESELSQDALSSRSEGTDHEEVVGAELSADLSPISQTSPISMSPASPGNSGLNSPITGSMGRDPVVMKIHSRRFREYCTQILDKEIDQCCTALLQDLVKFQDRMYHKDPIKAKTKRRVVLGLREVTKHLKLKKIKCVIISPNLEKIQSKGGLDETLNNILNMCREQNVPFVFALGRRALGRACAKLVPVSVVGIFNYEGSESKYQSLISLTAAAREAYNAMVEAVEQEVAEHPSMCGASQASSVSGVPGIYGAHLGHSRTPSGCSAISFTSSILSEPISENFPQPEPEVDSKGYEIYRDRSGRVIKPLISQRAALSNDIDDGNEADTEDLGDLHRGKKGNKSSNAVRFSDQDSAQINVGSISEKTNNLCISDDSKKDFPFLSNSIIHSDCIEKNLEYNTEDEEEDDILDNSAGSILIRNVSENSFSTEDGNKKIDDVDAESTMKESDSVCSTSTVTSRRRHVSKCQDGEERSEIGSDENANNCGNSSGAWQPMAHIDSIHSMNYDLQIEIFSHQIRSIPEDTIGKNEKSVRCSNPHDDTDDHKDEEEKDKEERRSHHRVIDKERIKHWLESQSSNVTPDSN